MVLAAVPNTGRRIRRFPVAAAQTYVEGAPVLLNGAGAIVEAGADPAVILGFAAHNAVLDFDPDPGFGLVFVAYPDSTFFLRGTSAPVAADIGVLYELGVDATGVAIVDKTAVVNTRLLVEDIYLKPGESDGFFEVSILAANRQFQQ